MQSLSGKQLKDRLAENHQNYVRVSEIHSYGADFSKLETMYGEDGAKVLSKSDWENTTYTQIEKYISNKKKGHQLNIILLFQILLYGIRKRHQQRQKVEFVIF